MRVGDLLELLGLGCLCAAAYLAAGLEVGLVAAGLTLVYEGQLYGQAELRRPRPLRSVRRVIQKAYRRVHPVKTPAP